MSPSALASLLIASTAFASTRIGVLPFAPLAGDVPLGAGEKGADLLLKELAHLAELEVVPRPESNASSGVAALAQARAKLTEARALVAAHEGRPAVEAYRTALAGFAAGIAELDTFEDVVAAQAELGTLFYRLGRDDEGQKAIAEAMRLSPGQPLKAIAESATFAGIAEGLQKKVGKLGKGAARVESSPAGADLYVDGLSAGKTPVVLRDLPEGRHYLRALLPSGEKWGTVVEVVPKGEQHLRAQSGAQGPAGDVAGQLAENSLQPATVASLKKAAEAQKVSLLVFGALHRTPKGLALDPFLFNSDHGKVSRLKRVAFDAEFLEAGLQLDKVAGEVQQRMGSEGAPLALPAKVAPDLSGERELATEFHFGAADALGEPSGTAPSATPGSADSPGSEDEGGGRRVITKRPKESE